MDHPRNQKKMNLINELHNDQLEYVPKSVHLINATAQVAKSLFLQ